MNTKSLLEFVQTTAFFYSLLIAIIFYLIGFILANMPKKHRPKKEAPFLPIENSEELDAKLKTYNF